MVALDVQRGFWILQVLMGTKRELCLFPDCPFTPGGKEAVPSPGKTAACTSHSLSALLCAECLLAPHLFFQTSSFWHSSFLVQATLKENKTVFIDCAFLLIRFYLRSCKVTAVIGQSDPISPVVKHNCHSKSFNYCLNHGWIACAECKRLLHLSWKWDGAVCYCAK